MNTTLYDDINLEDEDIEKLRISLSISETRLLESVEESRVAKAKASAMEESVRVLEVNISSLFSTAKLEMHRKDAELDKLRRLLDRERVALFAVQEAMREYLEREDRVCEALREALRCAGFISCNLEDKSSALNSESLGRVGLAAKEWDAWLCDGQKLGLESQCRPSVLPVNGRECVEVSQTTSQRGPSLSSLPAFNAPSSVHAPNSYPPIPWALPSQVKPNDPQELSGGIFLQNVGESEQNMRRKEGRFFETVQSVRAPLGSEQHQNTQQCWPHPPSMHMERRGGESQGSVYWGNAREDSHWSGRDNVRERWCGKEREGYGHRNAGPPPNRSRSRSRTRTH